LDPFGRNFPGDVRVGEQIAQTLAEEGQNEASLQRFEALAKKTASADDARSIGDCSQERAIIYWA